MMLVRKLLNRLFRRPEPLPGVYCTLCRQMVTRRCIDGPSHLALNGVPVITCGRIADDEIIFVGKNGEERVVNIGYDEK